MSDAENRKGLKAYFGDAVKDESTMLECLSILRFYSLPPDELFIKWETFLLNHLRPTKDGRPHEFSLEHARELRKEIQREAQAKGNAGAGGSGTPGGVGGGGKVRMGGIGGGGGNKRSSMGGGGLDLLNSMTGGSPATPSFKKPKPSSSATPTIPSRLFPSSSSSTSGPSRSTPTQSYPTSYDSADPAESDRTPRAKPPLYSNASHSQTPSRLSSSTPSNGTPISYGGGGGGGAAGSANQFRDRKNALTVTDSLNPHLREGSVPAVPFGFGGKSRIALTAGSDPKTYDYKYMFEKISARSDDEFTELIKIHHDVREEVSDPSETGEDTAFVTGLLHTDSLSQTSSKLTPTSLLLQSSRARGSGSRTPLRFADNVLVRGGPPGVPGAGLFVGCICGFRGKNASGGWFLVEEILLPPPGDMPITPAEELLENQYSESKLNGAPISLFTASGPYTVDSDLGYAPFQALIDEVNKSRPDVLILLGPFVDSSHPLLRVGATTLTPLEIFHSKIRSPLQTVLESCPQTTIILVPSVRDLLNEQMAFPQAMFSREKLEVSKKIKLLPNPCVININEITIGISTVDVLFHLRKEIYFHKATEVPLGSDLPPSSSSNGTPVDMMANVCRSVLNQRIFYPMYPVPSEASADVNLDLTHLDLLKLESSPDILILPSNLGKFAKIVDSVLFVNPSHLTKHVSGGTFAKMAIHPHPKEELVAAASGGGGGGDGEELEHAAHSRVRVDIVRI